LARTECRKSGPEMGEAVKLPFGNVDRVRPGSYLGRLTSFGPSCLTADVATTATG
jgi:hypothetical protein